MECMSPLLIPGMPSNSCLCQLSYATLLLMSLIVNGITLDMILCWVKPIMSCSSLKPCKAILQLVQASRNSSSIFCKETELLKYSSWVQPLLWWDDGTVVLICCQIDDFTITSTNQAASLKLIKLINKWVTIDDMGLGTLDEHGLSILYNGLNMHQAADHIRILATTNILMFLATHGWDADSKAPPPTTIPLSPSLDKKLQTKLGP